MNRFLLLNILLLLVFPSLQVRAIPLTDNANRHNLSSAATSADDRLHAVLPELGGTTEICVFCHTPHGASPQSTLWNRPEPGNMGTFPLYGSPLVIKGDFPASPAGAADHSQYKDDGSVEYPNGASKMCLSCHDGNTAKIGEVISGPAIAMVGTFPASAIISLDVSHPVSFIYNDVVLGDILEARGIGTYARPDPSADTDVPLDGQSRMQCTTCHDPHDDTRSEAHGLPFWRHNTNVLINEYEDVCNTCHKETDFTSSHLPASNH